jgi:hypothetical protein
MLNGFSMRLALLFCVALIGGVALTGCGDDNAPKSAEIGSTGAGGEDNTQVTASKGATEQATDPEDSNKDTNKISEEPPPVQILTGNYTGVIVKKPTVMIVQSDKARRSMLNEIFSHGVKRQPNVAGSNFKDRQQVGLFLPKSPKGTVVVITDVHQDGDHVVVTGVELTNGDGCKNSGAKPRPFHVVETRKMTSTGAPVVRLSKQAASPC